jgi:hypothetical protein
MREARPFGLGRQSRSDNRALFIFSIGFVMTVGFAGFGAAAGGAASGLAGCFPLFFCLFTVPFMLIGG